MAKAGASGGGRPPATLGIVGAGTMGAGIAQLGCAAQMTVLLHDPLPDALELGTERVRAGLAKWAEKGRAGAEAGALLRPARELEQLEDCELVIEAAPERAELKRELFGRLSAICDEDAVLASNTSSIPVTALAGAAARPENVVGMHFFNPAPLMPLVEVIAGVETAERALGVARAAGEAMGKRVILASDSPGFLVNRCGRPFGAEALRLLGERAGSPEEIDRICRLGGGFRMGPFELMDLVGVDVGFEVAKSFWELSFGEPRWKPSPIQARMTQAGRHGRKAGRGYYSYENGPHRADDPEPRAPGGGEGRVVAIEGASVVARELGELAARAGFDVRETTALDTDAPELVVDAAVPAPASDLELLPGGPPQLAICADRSLAARGAADACGFHLLPPLAETRLAELVRLPTTSGSTYEAARHFFDALGLHVQWVAEAPGAAEAPGLVLGRIVCQLVNEAAFAIGEGVGSAEDVDAGMTLGLSHPRGPVAWAGAIGAEHVLATIDGLHSELREERYRAAPLLRRAAGLGVELEQAAGG